MWFEPDPHPPPPFTDETHGVTLTIPITDSDTRTFSTPPQYSTRRSAKEFVAMEALRAGVPALMEAAFRERLVFDTGGFITFEAGAKETVVDAVIVLNREVKLNLAAGVKALTFTFTSVAGEGKGKREQAPGSTTSTPLDSNSVISRHSLRYGATLSVQLDQHTTRTYVIPPTYPSRPHARHAAAALALKEGIVAEMKKIKKGGKAQAGQLPNQAGKAEPTEGPSAAAVMVEYKVLGPVPKPGAVDESTYDTMDQ